MHVLVTRPEPQASRTADRIRGRGWRATVAPLLSFRPFADAPIPEGPFAALVLTSQNAVRALCSHPAAPRLRGLPVIAVGEATARAAAAAGFADVTSAGGTAADLAAAIAADGWGKAPLLCLTARDKAADLGALLATRPIALVEIPVYAMETANAAPATLLAAAGEGGPDVLTLFSARTAEALARLLARDPRLEPLRQRRALALSDAVARPLLAAGFARVTAAPRPDEDAMLAALERFATAAR